MWCIPPKQNADFVARMEEVLEVYSRPFDEKRPVICMDEKPFQLLDEMFMPIPLSEDNHSVKYDCEYVRKGSCSIFMFTEPLGQWREAHALPHRTSEDWAREMKWLIDKAYPDAEKIVLVMDNLNTHTAASFYKVFPARDPILLGHKTKQFPKGCLLAIQHHRRQNQAETSLSRDKVLMGMGYYEGVLPIHRTPNKKPTASGPLQSALRPAS